MYKFLTLIIVCSGFGSCELYRTLHYGGLPRQNDYKHFPQRIVENQKPTFYFTQPNQDYNLGKTIGLTNRDLNSTNISLDSFVNIHNTISFVIIRNDTILYERYTTGYKESSIVSTFSMVKPIVSTLIGIAIDEGKIKSKEDFIVDYLPEYRNKIGWDKITIENLLHHTSGIKFTDNKFNPLSDNAEFYWGNNNRKEMLKLSLECPPNTKFKYSSANTQLLGIIIEKITGGTVSHYLSEKLWKPLGMETTASWSLDRKDSKAIEKVFCCLQAKTIDFAKFGRLYLNKGNWNGKQIVSKEWVNYSTHPDPRGNNKHFFNNNWGIGPLKYESYYAVGLYGQHLYMYPEKNIIIARFGNTETSYHPGYWQSIFLQLIDQL
jgi:CubicO group peptidase (beta-lactamase class C family)